MIAQDKDFVPTARAVPEAENRQVGGAVDRRLVTPARKAMSTPFGASGARATTHQLAQLGGQQRAFGGPNNFAGLLGFSVSPVQAGDEEVTSPYHQNWVGYRSIRWLAEAAATISLPLFSGPEEKAERLPEDHPLVRLFNSPNEITSSSDLVEANVVNMLCYGEDFWFLYTEQGKPVATKGRLITEVPSQFVQAGGAFVMDERNEFGLPVKWGYSSAGSSKSLNFPAAAVLQHKFYDPADVVRGVGPLEIALRQISVMFQSERYVEATSRTGGPGGWLINKNWANKDEQDRQQEDLHAVQQNPAENTGLRALWGEWTIVTNPTNPKDMQTVETIDRCIDAIAGTIGCPLQLIGIMRDATHRNYEEANKQGWTRAAALVLSLAKACNSKLFPRFSDPKLARVRMVPDLSKVEALRTDDSSRHKIAAEIAASGVGLSMEDAQRALGLNSEKTQFGGVAFGKSGTTTIERVVTPPEEPKPEGEAPADGDPDKGAGNADDQDKSHGSAGRDGDCTLLLDTSVQRRRLLSQARQYTKEERAEYWRQFNLRILEPYEERLARHTKRWLDAYAKAQVEKLTEYANDETRALSVPVEKDLLPGDENEIVSQILLDQARWRELLSNATGSTLESLWETSLKDTAEELNGIAIPMSDPRVIHEMSVRDVQLTEGVTSRLAERVKEITLEELRTSTTTGTLQQRIKAELPDLTSELKQFFGSNDSRALTIARTETGKAANGARYLQFLEEGVQEIEWASEGDEFVRDAHEALDGKVVAIGEEFEPGLKHPGDPNGSAEQVVNCRCIPLPVIREEEPAQ